MTKPLIIEIDAENATMCLANGETVVGSEHWLDIKGCSASGDVEDACRYVLESIGIDFRIVAKDADGNYENRTATAAEKQATCEAIYLESERDFSDEEWSELYLVWEAANEFS